MKVFDNYHIWHPYAKIPNEVATYLVESADGVYLKFDNGNQVIDGMSSWWSVIHGYNNPVLNSAISSQLQSMAHVMFGGLTHKPAIELAKTLIRITPRQLDKVFFADSGSVAVEVALKIALQYWQNMGAFKKNKFVALRGGYHGDTFAAMAVCDPDNSMCHLFKGVCMQNFFAKQPLIDNTKVAIDDLESIFNKEQQNIAAMILEPIVQGAGGMNIYAKEYLATVRKLCDRYNILLIIDEIATGFGRTGKLFAAEYADISADILCLGKALTGGYMTLAATITTDKVAKTVGTLMHGPTFMANPLACALANTSINLLLNTNWQKNIKRIEKILTTKLIPLKSYKTVRSVRVLGAIGVVEMTTKIDISFVQKFLIKQGVWLRPYNKLLYTMPPFIIKDEQLIKITDAIKNVVSLN